MRRDYVTFDVRGVSHDGEDGPTAVLAFDGPADVLTERLVDAEGNRLSADQLDVAYRLRDDTQGESGVFSLADRVTGEFVMEVNAGTDEVFALVDAARDGSDRSEGHYTVEIRRDGETEAAYEKRTLLVYDDEGDLLRGESLIPSGVEL
jgi:hypothetical protein